MTPAEVERSFDLLGADSDAAILAAARKGEDQTITLAAAVLELPDGAQRLALTDNEYGDGEGIGLVQSFIRGCKTNRLLKKGELLYARLLTVTGYTVQSLESQQEPKPGTQGGQS